MLLGGDLLGARRHFVILDVLLTDPSLEAQCDMAAPARSNERDLATACERAPAAS